jgi:micrococcal nuclease
MSARTGGRRVCRLVAAALLALALLAGCGGDREREPRADRGAPAPEPAPRRMEPPANAPRRTCTRVVDGDTVILDGGERVRLIGVDTPELHRPNTPVQYYAREARAFTRRLAEHRAVRLDYDQTRRDRYGRTLAYVFLEDGTFVNLEIVRQGYGFAYTRFPFRYMEAFRAAERAARESGAGLWARPDSLSRAASPA